MKLRASTSQAQVATTSTSAGNEHSTINNILSAYTLWLEKKNMISSESMKLVPRLARLQAFRVNLQSHLRPASCPRNAPAPQWP